MSAGSAHAQIPTRTRSGEDALKVLEFLRGVAYTIFSYTPGGMTRYTWMGWETFLNVRSPTLSSTNWALMRSAVVGPTMISPPWADPAKRAARLVVGPVAVNVHRWPAPAPILVAPPSASPLLMPMCSCTGGNTPPVSSFRCAGRWRMAKDARVAFSG